jgi:predicted dehydrogenase
MKVAVVGAGRWGRNLVKTFHELGALAAVVESDSKILNSLSQDFPGIALFPNLEDVLRSDTPALAIATPAATHYEVARKALLAGKDAFVEKPLSLCSQEAEELAELASSKKKILMVGHLLLHQPAIQWIHDNLAELGTISSIHMERLNLGTVRSVENALWSLGVHDVSVLLYLMDEAPSRVAVSGQRSLQPGVEDDVYLHLFFKKGSQAHLHVSWLWPERRRQLVAIGSKGMIVYDELKQEVTLHRKTIGKNLENKDEGSELVFRGDPSPLKRELVHFLECVKNRTEPRSGARNGIDVVKVMEKATQALQENA